MLNEFGRHSTTTKFKIKYPFSSSLTCTSDQIFHHTLQGSRHFHFRIPITTTAKVSSPTILFTNEWMLLNSQTCTIRIYIDWLIIYGFTSLSRIFHLYGDVTIAGEGLQNLGLCSALRAFEQGGIFIVPHLLWHGTSVFPVSSEGPPHLVASYDTRGDVEDLF